MLIFIFVICICITKPLHLLVNIIIYMAEKNIYTNKQVSLQLNNPATLIEIHSQEKQINPILEKKNCTWLFFMFKLEMMLSH